MGPVHQRVTLSAEKAVTVRMLVDTGATFSVIPEALARAVGIQRLRRAVTITLGARRRVKLDAGTAIFRIGGREAPTTILVGDARAPLSPFLDHSLRLGRHAIGPVTGEGVSRG